MTARPHDCPLNWTTAAGAGARRCAVTSCERYGLDDDACWTCHKCQVSAATATPKLAPGEDPSVWCEASGTQAMCDVSCRHRTVPPCPGPPRPGPPSA